MPINRGFACPCCQYKTLDERGGYDICCVCFWEDDGNNDPTRYSGPNHITLGEGQKNFEKFGACDLKSISSILKEGPSKFEREAE